MIIIPAIDLYGGKCVRLYKGDFNQMTSYADDPAEVARQFEALGCTHLHVVDLEGARVGQVQQASVLESIASATDLMIDFGGGIKTDADVTDILNAGAHKFTAGSIAAKNQDMVHRWLEIHGSEKVILGADARNRKVAVDGWSASTSLDVIDFISDYVRSGITQAICTDIETDGTLSGPSSTLYKEIMRESPELNLIASGGVRDLTHIEQLIKIGVTGVIVGKAIYEGTLDLKKAIGLC
jgi:phosphoribosylformimino-5-aminoimidazole carboxamide ribotide isomerase